MKNTSLNLFMLLIFIMTLIILFWMMSDTKIDTIGNFFEKLLTPLAYPLSVFISFVIFGKHIKKIKKSFSEKEKKK